MRERVLGALGRGGRGRITWELGWAAEMSLGTESPARYAMAWQRQAEGDPTRPHPPSVTHEQAVVDTPANLCISGSASVNRSSCPLFRPTLALGISGDTRRSPRSRLVTAATTVHSRCMIGIRVTGTDILRREALVFIRHTLQKRNKKVYTRSLQTSTHLKSGQRWKGCPSQ